MDFQALVLYVVLNVYLNMQKLTPFGAIKFSFTFQRMIVLGKPSPAKPDIYLVCNRMALPMHTVPPLACHSSWPMDLSRIVVFLVKESNLIFRLGYIYSFYTVVVRIY